MDLILWRHAEAEEGDNDLARELTPKGEKQAARVAEWLLQRLPRSSPDLQPAARAQQTAEALGVPVKTVKDMAPGAAVSAILKAAAGPSTRHAWCWSDTSPTSATRPRFWCRARRPK
jgi:phosphohistidine phosphatase